MAEKLKFKKDSKTIALSEDFFYMLEGGGWIKPEYYLEEEDAKRVREAIDLIVQFQYQGIEEGFFEEI